jgi:hypothetical protein
MGNNHSKQKKKILIPDNYKLVKLFSYNINLNNTVNSENKIKHIINYIDKNGPDIICIQGIGDSTSGYNLIKAINSYAHTNNFKIYIAPQVDIDIQPALDDPEYQNRNLNLCVRSLEGLNTYDSSYKNNKSKTRKSKKNHNLQNIIISKYLILNIMYSELDDFTTFDDIVGVHSVVGVNILINNNIISIYNTDLCNDIHQSNIISDRVRQSELDTLFNLIDSNRIDILKDYELSKYTNNDLHILVGTLNIDENNGNNHDLNEEYKKLIVNYRCFDIFRYKYPDSSGVSTVMNNRHDYIMLILSNFVDDKSFQKIKNNKDMIDFVHKKYKIYFLDIDINSEVSHSVQTNNYAIESMFMIQNPNSPGSQSSPI